MTLTPTRRDHVMTVAQATGVAAPFSPDHLRNDSHGVDVEGTISPAANAVTSPKVPPRQESFSLDQITRAPHRDAVEGTIPPAARVHSQTTESARQDPVPLDQRRFEHQGAHVEGSSHAAISQARTMTDLRRGPFLYNPFLCLLADSLDDLERTRIAAENRFRSLTRSEADKDGEVRGLGLDVRSPQVARVAALVEGLQKLEHQATLDLQREVRASPFWPWIEASKGVGQKQAARLLAAVGDPYWNDLHDRPRTVSELWAYCGYAVNSGHAQRRTKGVKANWNDIAKMRVYLIAESCVKATGGGYRAVYDDARAQYAEAVHPHDCVRCGPAGHPALAGTPLSAGHQHARSLRRVAKTVLKDLWLLGRDLHEGDAA